MTFTGSVPTGRAVATGAAPGLARVTLELGGNDAAVLLDDVEVEAVADRLFWAAFRNCGQVCMAVKRVYAPAQLHARVVEALAERAKTVVVGSGLAPGTELGPVNNAAQLARVERCTARALEEGARAVAGGHRLDRPGYFYPPTILTDVPPDSPVVMEEQFGPVLPVLPYGHLDEAVEAANATRYGLGGSVWGTDLDRAEEVAGRLECGTAWINHHAELSLDQPFAGIKDSGVGVAGGPWGLYGNLRPFVVHRPGEGADEVRCGGTALVRGPVHRRGGEAGRGPGRGRGPGEDRGLRDVPDRSGRPPLGGPLAPAGGARPRGGRVVVETGGPETGLSPGDHVVLGFDSCGHCRGCLAGSPAYCDRFAALNLFGGRPEHAGRFTDAAGGALAPRWFGQSSFAAYAMVPARNAVRVDPSLPLELLGPLGCGFLTGAGAVLNSFGAGPGDTVAVFGAGAVGLAAVMAATAAGAVAVAVDRHPERLAFAEKLNAVPVHAASAGLPDRIRRLTDGGAQYALDTTGSGRLINDALRALRPLGHLGLVARLHTALALEPGTLDRGGGSPTSARGTRCRGCSSHG